MNLSNYLVLWQHNSRARDVLDHAVAGEFSLVEAWPSLSSLKRKEHRPDEPPDDRGNPTMSFRGERRRNATHHSLTDPEGRLARKGSGKEVRLCTRSTR